MGHASICSYKSADDTNRVRILPEGVGLSEALDGYGFGMLPGYVPPNFPGACSRQDVALLASLLDTRAGGWQFGGHMPTPSRHEPHF